jgi:hypothetical protein
LGKRQGNSKKDAEKRLRGLIHQLDNGNFIKPGKATLAEYFGEAA